MKKQRLLVLIAFSCLVIIATLIGCGTPVIDGFLIPVRQAAVARFAFVVNGSPESSYDVTLSAYTVNASTGALTAVSGSPFATSISGCCGTVFIGVDPNSRFLYLPMGDDDDRVAVYSINQTTGALTEISGSPFPSGGNGPFSAQTDPSGNFLYVANRAAMNLAAFTVGSGGSLTAIGSPHDLVGNPYFIIMDPQGRFLYVTVETEGYVVHGFAINSSTGALTEVPNSPFSTASRPRSGTVDASGHFLLVANRGANEVSVYSIDQSTGALTAVSGSPFAAGNGPFTVVEAINGNNTFVAVNNLYGDNASVYSFNTSTGSLTPVSGSPFDFSFARPHFMATDPSGGFGYVVNQSNDTITGVTVNASGVPAQITGSPFTTGGLRNPSHIVISH